MKFCCCTTPCTKDDEREPLLSGENQEPQRNPLQSPLRRKLSPAGYEQSAEEPRIERQQAATNTESQPDENAVPDVEIKPAGQEKPARDKPGTKPPDQKGAKTDKKGTKQDEGGAEAKETKSKVLEFKKFVIPELDCIFTDFKITFDPFVQNREDMSQAEDSFKKAVMSLEQISPHAKFSDYVAALKTRLKTEGITVKIKEGAMTIYQEGKKTVKGISDAVTAVNGMLKLAKDLKAMPLTIARGSEDAVERADALDVQGILKREFQSLWDYGKIPKIKKAFSNNVKQVKRAPEMVRDFCRKIKEIILEIYHAFADEEDQKKMEEELAEDDDTSKDDEKTEEGATGGSNSKKEGKKRGETSEDKKKEEEEKKKKKDEFHKKLKFESIGLGDIDNVFTSLGTAINPFVETCERLQAARESFENIVKSICNIEVKKELKDYIKELKKDAKEGNITIYIDEVDGEIKVKSIEGVKPPKPYRDAVQALKNIKSAGNEAVELEPHVQHGIGQCVDRITQIDPQRDFHSLLKKKSDVFSLPGKIKKFNDNRKKAQEIPGIVKEFCLYVESLLTDILEALTGEKDADPADKKDEDSEKAGDKSSAGEDEPASKNDEDSSQDEKSSPGKDEPAGKENHVSGEAKDQDGI
ncbi:hypothetical protein ACROYT_G029494 [Oculina patagonica]